jgi:Arc/MetJ-type ribon-helix-helix transcriptional regulator
MPATEKVFVRMDAELLRGVDRYVERIRAEHPGLRPTRSEAIRALVYQALQQMEAEDQADIEAAREALADPERLPYEQARRELGL